MVNQTIQHRIFHVPLCLLYYKYCYIYYYYFNYFFQPLLPRFRRAAAVPSQYAAAGSGDEHEHDLLHELTHSFHIGSMAILSILLAEVLLRK